MSDKNTHPYSTTQGCPIFSPNESEMIGTPGPLLLQDQQLVELLAQFARERIPERVVHASGVGAHGVFEVTDDVTDISAAKFLSEVGKKTKTFTRISTVSGEAGSSQVARDPRGFATKLYTEDGNLDWVFLNQPVFFIRDPTKFPFVNRSQKRNPKTNLPDPNMFWDYLTLNEESAHMVMMLFSDRGTPYGIRHMNGFSCHTYTWIKADGSFNYVQIHLKSDQGIKNFTNEEAIEMSGKNPNFSQQDLFDSIERGDYPSWTCYVQTMSPEEAQKQPFSVFDMTKTWPQDKFPLRRFGKLTFNVNAENYFADVEQAAFSPSNRVPGWDASADPVLQSRLFSYPDSQRYRLGSNYYQIPVNKCPFANDPFVRDGKMSVNGNYGGQMSYPSTLTPLTYDKKLAPKATDEHIKWVGTATAWTWTPTAEDWKQPAELWELYGKTDQQDSFVHNVVVHASEAEPSIQKRVVGYFSKVNKDLGERIEKGLASHKA